MPKPLCVAIGYLLTGFACNTIGLLASLAVDDVNAKRITWLAVGAGTAAIAGTIHAPPHLTTRPPRPAGHPPGRAQ